MSQPPKFPYIIPPGLHYKVREFEAHCKVAQSAPIMICGPSGVGKSLFLHIFKQLYREKAGPKPFLVTVNCSHFTGDIARSELFGHARGAFTGAVEENEGWIEKAHGGVLILEEVGDLPPETQAKLLSFVETGEYHKMGCSSIRSSDVQIVAATNRRENLREDFRHRFFPFHIPPLHERRGDILYHLAMKIPELISQLASWEVLALLAHHWPGNVREVEKTALLLKRRKVLEAEDPAIDLWEEVARAMESRATDEEETLRDDSSEISANRRPDMSHFKNVVLEGNRIYRLCQTLKTKGVNVKEIHDLLRKFHLGILLNREDLAFNTFKEDPPGSSFKLDTRLNVRILNTVTPFELAYKGLRVFCHLLLKNRNGAENLLDPQDVYSVSAIHGTSPHLLEYPPEIRGLAETIHRSLDPTSHNRAAAPQWITSMSRNQLMKTYYKALLTEAKGKKSVAARVAGLKYSTFREALRKYELL